MVPLWSTALAGALLTSCPAERAVYTLRSEGPSVTAQFHKVRSNPDWPTGLALEIRIGATGHRYWFLPWQGGTDGKTNLAWVPGPGSPPDQPVRQDLEFFATDSSYRFLGEVPRSGRPAPDRLLLPELGFMLWYRTPGNRRDSVPRAFFDLTGCRDAQAARVETRVELPPVP
jgi:hypothetical protein